MRLSAIVSLVAGFAGLAAAAEPWEQLPPTPKLPGSPAGTLANINGAFIWYAEFGQPAAGKPPVILLHGGFGNSDYWGDVVALLQGNHHVIVMDTRGQGRSTLSPVPLTYPLLAKDVVALLTTLGHSNAAWVGWSDMATATMAALMDPQHSKWVERAFLFGGTHEVAATNASFTSTAIYQQFVTRALAEYSAFHPNGDVQAAAKAVQDLESTQPTWTRADFDKITLGSKVTVSDGQYEEAVVRTEPALLNQWIAGSKLVTIADSSHFAVLQQPKLFAAALETFLAA